MRFNSLPLLGAILYLEASGASATVICDPESTRGINNTNAFVPRADVVTEVTQQCIEDVCATIGNNYHCGPVILSISLLSSPSPDVGTCVGQFRSIIDQCITAGSILGGASQISGALYEVSVVQADWAHFQELSDRPEEVDDGNEDLKHDVWSDSDHWAEKRALEEEHNAQNSGIDEDEDEDENPSLEARKTKGKNKTKTKTDKITPKKTVPERTTPEKTTPGKTAPSKTTPDKNRPQKTKPKFKTDKSSKTKQPQSCPLPKKKPGPTPKAGKTPKPGKSPKTVATGKKAKGTKDSRDTAEDFLPEIVSSAKFPRGHGQSKQKRPKKNKKPAKNCAMSEWYKEEVLVQPDEVIWRSYNKKSGWKDEQDKEALTILRQMGNLGKLDVIEVENGWLGVQGNAQGTKVSPNSYAGKQGNYLLCNGGFFNMGNFHPVGETSVSDVYEQIPEAYKDDYVRLKGDDDSFLHTGPGLMGQDFSFGGSKWKYHKADGTKTRFAEMTGSLAHASQANERLAIVTMNDFTDYVFVYTAAHRRDGLDLQELRDLMELWLKTYTEYKVKDMVEAANLDGGGSIYVSWNQDGVETKIASGNIGDEFPVEGARREMANVITIEYSPEKVAAASL